ncbi:Scr1 family TA system antitoxin-like transcriptional regulator [Streptomyces jumonjinensis]|uniref:Scr1 family TA system antitoxin-like transcriptional regulator n=1 Tax=Streptomyces jumonjinensis TaxID=1945 RepID=UPI00378B7A35
MASTIRSRRLGSELRKLRESLKLKDDAVARAMGFSRSKLNRIELGENKVAPNDLKALLDHYDVTEPAQREHFMAAAKEARKPAGWWQRYQDSLPREYADFIELEATSSAIQTFQPNLIPGLLQTPAYMRAVIGANPAILPPADIEGLVKIKQDRQGRLTADEPPRLWAIIGESAVRQTVGGCVVMLEQLQHLEQMTTAPHVTIQVLPHSAGAHAGLTGGFVTFSFPSEREPDIVCVETQTGTLYMDEPGERSAYGEIFDHLRAAAKNPADSMDLIHQVMKEIKGEGT